MNSPHFLEPIISASDIQTRVQELGRLISKNYEQSELHLVGILKGSFIFLADLVRAINIPSYVHFVRASSYVNQQSSSGEVQFSNDLQLSQKHILIVEDIVDTGLTLQRVLQDFEQQSPASLEVCTLLSKKVPRLLNLNIRYVGFYISNEFVVGYGLDISECYRGLPYIAKIING